MTDETAIGPPPGGDIFWDDGLGWQNVAVGRIPWGEREACVIATLASSEDPISPAYLTPAAARGFAAALIRAADEAETKT